MKNYLLILGIVVCALSAQADVYFGGNARAAGMAGAGIATITDSPTSQVINSSNAVRDWFAFNCTDAQC